MDITWILRMFPGMAVCDHTREILNLLKAMWGLKDAPRAFGMRLSRFLKEIGYHQGVTDPHIWCKLSQNSGPALGSHCGFHPNL
eukprot:5536082-Prorocentrum_lima.AAC.1